MIKVNLLPKEARGRVGLGQQIFLIVTVLILNFVGIGMYWSYLNNVIEEKKQRKAQIEERLEELEKIIAEIQKFEERTAELERKLEIIEQLKKEQQMPVRFLNELYLSLEEDVWLRSMAQSGFFASETESLMNITGTALSNPVVAQYVRNLQQSPYFNEVQLSFSQERQISSQIVRDFEINAKLTVAKGMAEEDGESDDAEEASE